MMTRGYTSHSPWNGPSRVLDQNFPQMETQHNILTAPQGPEQHTPLLSDSHGFFPKVPKFGRGLRVGVELLGDSPCVLLSRIHLQAKSTTYCWEGTSKYSFVTVSPPILPFFFCQWNPVARNLFKSCAFQLCCRQYKETQQAYIPQEGGYLIRTENLAEGCCTH